MELDSSSSCVGIDGAWRGLSAQAASRTVAREHGQSGKSYGFHISGESTG